MSIVPRLDCTIRGAHFGLLQTETLVDYGAKGTTSLPASKLLLEEPPGAAGGETNLRFKAAADGGGGRSGAITVEPTDVNPATTAGAAASVVVAADPSCVERNGERKGALAPPAALDPACVVPAPTPTAVTAALCSLGIRRGGRTASPAPAAAPAPVPPPWVAPIPIVSRGAALDTTAPPLLGRVEQDARFGNLLLTNSVPSASSTTLAASSSAAASASALISSTLRSISRSLALSAADTMRRTPAGSIHTSHSTSLSPSALQPPSFFS
eukprot:CAMPEP_0181363022 /NCGR_PEP_ID=MMETSP1106-20121128/8432_1 /TAXON_ID=81844 /ORGANISM="Mantoniella antarctica, Strain SL-175" /LENGTH=268 /DNA_ID=CAMNT_0023477243 /DNA_START=402 /DNA_END=1206 /DNA_ORIENTATION=+